MLFIRVLRYDLSVEKAQQTIYWNTSGIKKEGKNIPAVRASSVYGVKRADNCY